MKMNKLLGLLGLMASVSFAASTGNLTLSGTVTATYNITITPDGTNNTTLNILAGESLKSVADVLEESNDPAGYKIQATSANNGKLKNGTVDEVSYQVKYGAGSLTSLTTSAQTLFTSSTLSSPASNSQNVKVSFTGKPTALAGTFSDTVTFSISAP